MNLRASLVAFAATTLFALPAPAAGVHRYALLVGSSEGLADEPHLLFAKTDAERIAKVLHDLGDVQTEDMVLLTDPDADAVRRALIALNTRIRDEAGSSVLFVFYSGHADAEALHLDGTRLPTSEVRDLVYGSAADARILVVDACRSGSMTRIKGGRPAPSFAIDVDPKLAASGVAILTSSAAGEDSQESDRLGASFFTHYLASGMIGAADRDADGQVTLGEAFAYASERTLAATTGTLSGPQHPTYRYDFGGHEDLVLTAPGRDRRRYGVLELPEPGTYLVQRGSTLGAVVAEVATEDGGRRVSLPADTYVVTRRESRRLLEGKISVTAGQISRMPVIAMHDVSYARLVRKGSLDRRSSWGPFFLAGYRGPLLELDGAPWIEGGARLDLRPISLELRAGVTKSSGTLRFTPPGATQERVVPVRANEQTLSFTALRVFDAGPVSLGVGAVAGALRLERRLGPPPGPNPPTTQPRNVESWGYVAGPLAQLETRLAWRITGRVETGATAYFAQPLAPPGVRPGSLKTSWGWRAVAGIGFAF